MKKVGAKKLKYVCKLSQRSSKNIKTLKETYNLKYRFCEKATTSYKNPYLSIL